MSAPSAEKVITALENAIAQGLLKPGQRLPSERAMAIEYQVSRTTVREALSRLNARHLVFTRRGGGSYVSTAFGESFTDPLMQLLSTRKETASDVLEFRFQLEGFAASLAAERATPADLAIIEHRYNEYHIASAEHKHAEQAKADGDFHMAIAEASHNVVLLHVMRSLLTLLHRSIELSFNQIFTHSRIEKRVLAQHQAIKEAIFTQDPEAAKRHSEAHIDYVRSVLREQATQRQREQLAQQRLNQLDPQ